MNRGNRRWDDNVGCGTFAITSVQKGRGLRFRFIDRTSVALTVLRAAGAGGFLTAAASSRIAAIAVAFRFEMATAAATNNGASI
jgi:hypothetical protein